jgi:hypothetical protein
MYKLLPKTEFGEPTCLLRVADNAFIPFDPDNTDYQEFLAWCEQGNTPLPADGE